MAETYAEANQLAAGANHPSPLIDDGRAAVGARALAYLLDSVLLFGFAMAFSAAAFLVIWLGSDTGRGTISDGEEWGFVAFLLATFPVWMVFNVALAATRGHTVGQYVLGQRVIRIDGEKPSFKQALFYWLSLHPLLFHPFLALPWALLATLGVTIAGSEWVFILALAMAFLCLVTPLTNLIFMAIDPQRRGIHDRIAGMKVVRLQP